MRAIFRSRATKLLALLIALGLTYIATRFWNREFDTKESKTRVALVMNWRNLESMKSKCGAYPEIYFGDDRARGSCYDGSEFYLKTPIGTDGWSEPFVYFSDGTHFVIRSGRDRLLIDETGLVYSSGNQ